MAIDNKYLRIRVADYNGQPAFASTLQKRGKLHKPPEGEEDAVELTPWNATYRESVERDSVNYAIHIKHNAAGKPDRDGDESEATHIIVKRTDMGETEIREHFDLADKEQYTNPILLSHSECDIYLNKTGELPQ